MRLKNRKNTRKLSYGYSQYGSYFVTIRARNRIDYFGEINNFKMQKNEMGNIALNCWNEIKNHLRNIELDEFVVMPNHVHGILHLLPEENKSINVVTNHGLSLSGLSLSIKRMNERLPNVIKQYKSSVTRIIRQQLNNYQFQWQRSYHDRIIRNEKELNLIRQYIYNNPINWEKDDKNIKIKEIAARL